MWTLIMLYKNKNEATVSRRFEHETYGQAAYDMVDWIKWACDEKLFAYLQLTTPNNEIANVCSIEGGIIVS